MTKLERLAGTAELKAGLIAGACLLMAGLPARAQSPCGLNAVELLARGDTAALAQLFDEPAQVRLSLQELARRVGTLKAVQVVERSRFDRFQRTVVRPAPPLPNVPETWIGSWINAESDQLGPVQFQIAQVSLAGCRLVALSLDTAR